MPSVAPRSWVVYPIVLGGGTALFKDVRERHALRFLGAKPLQSGLVRLAYSTRLAFSMPPDLASSRRAAPAATRYVRGHRP
jgi:hypothetical protein